MNNVLNKEFSLCENSFEDLGSFKEVVKNIRKLPLTKVPLWNREGKQIGEALRVVIKALPNKVLPGTLPPKASERSEDAFWCPLGYLAGVRNSNHFYNSANRLQLTPDEACYIVDCLDNGRLP